MSQPDNSRGATAQRCSSVVRVLAIVAFGSVMFFAGRLWSLRQVQEARQAAGQAEEERIDLERQLNQARNQFLLQKLDGASSAD